MGNSFSRGGGGVGVASRGSDLEGGGTASTAQSATQANYRYPPKSGGQFFANHFIMGGEKFDSPQPESFLFGDNSDLNFLGPKPVPFPYPPPSATEPTRSLRALINIRRDSLHFSPAEVPPPGGVTGGGVAEPSGAGDASSAGSTPSTSEASTPEEAPPTEAPPTSVRRRYNIKFTFDSDCKCAITIYYFSTEEVTPSGLIYHSKHPSLTSKTFVYNKGAHQLFDQPSHVFEPAPFPTNDLANHENALPVVIHAVALTDTSSRGEVTSDHDINDTSSSPTRQSHVTIAVVERHQDGSCVIKALKQKLFADGLCYLLQEIYGLENKTLSRPLVDDDLDDNGSSECVVCMCDVRDTIILPCRHLCLCNACADSLRYQANNCPICRAPFRALLQIRAVQKTSHSMHPALQQTNGQPVDNEGIPPGYQGISLVDALNGPPCFIPSPQQQEAGSSTTDAGTDAAPRSRRHKRRNGSKSTRASAESAEGSARRKPQQLRMQIVDETTSSGGEVAAAAAVASIKQPPGSPKDSLDMVEEELANMSVVEPPEVVKEEEDETVVIDVRRDSSAVSLPGTPKSGISCRSSQDSSDSASSTKQLLQKTDLHVQVVAKVSSKVPTTTSVKVVNVLQCNKDEEEVQEDQAEC